MTPRDASISALLPVYAGVEPRHLQQALASVVNQSLPPDEVVVVEDGPLGTEHYAVLAALEMNHPCVKRVKLDVNQGAGAANRAGLLACTGTWVAKVDADDINISSRFAIQLDAVSRLGVDVCGSAMAEFVGSPDMVVRTRVNPLTHEAIAARMRLNNPVNHPTAFFRRDLALRVGGYSVMRYMEDYDLVARMLSAGAKMQNLPETLVLFRVHPETLERRCSGHAQFEWLLQQNLRRYGITNRTQQVRNLILRSAYRRLPRGLMSHAYATVFGGRPSREGANS